MATPEHDIPAPLAKAVEFHGHLCPGLVMGYLASKLGMERLGAERSEDEELIAIVENDSCAVDGVQVFTGCTTGKGNLFLRDYGKMVFIFALRPSGRAARVCLKPKTDPNIEQTQEDSQQRRGFEIQYMLQQPADELFSVREETILLPETARIHESSICELCGEMVMKPRTLTVDGMSLCIPCAEAKLARDSEH